MALWLRAISAWVANGSDAPYATAWVGPYTSPESPEAGWTAFGFLSCVYGGLVAGSEVGWFEE